MISTDAINCYGTRVITAGIDITQYKKNPSLLYMHKRGNVIGRMENLRIDDQDRLLGTPVFDVVKADGAEIQRQLEAGFLRMASANIDILDLSTDAADIVAGQRYGTVTKSKLTETSVVDIGGNDESLKLFHDGKELQLAAGGICDFLPLLKIENSDEQTDKTDNQNEQTKLKMEKLLLKLGLPANATEDAAIAAVAKLQENAGKVEQIELAHITGVVAAAVTANKITADKTEHFITLGKTSGVEALNQTLAMFAPAVKPTDILDQGNGGKVGNVELTKYSEATEEQLKDLLKTNKPAFIALFKAEFGTEPEIN